MNVMIISTLPLDVSGLFSRTAPSVFPLRTSCSLEDELKSANITHSTSRSARAAKEREKRLIDVSVSGPRLVLVATNIQKGRSSFAPRRARGYSTSLAGSMINY